MLCIMPRKKTDVEEVEKENVIENTEKKTTKTTTLPPLKDTDEIEIVSLIPNVSYVDTETNDTYEWNEVGDVEFMEFSAIKKMNRNFKSYFNKLWLKPNDERVIEKFGLKRLYEKYDFLLKYENYTRANITKITESLSSIPMGLKFSISDKIKEFVENEKITDVQVIKNLEKVLNTDLFELI